MEDMMEKLKSNIKMPTETGPEHERRQEVKTQQEQTAREAKQQQPQEQEDDGKRTTAATEASGSGEIDTTVDSSVREKGRFRQIQGKNFWRVKQSRQKGYIGGPQIVFELSFFRPE